MSGSSLRGAWIAFIAATGLFVPFTSLAHTTALFSDTDEWAIVLIEDRLPLPATPLCDGPDALRLFDSLRVRPEIGGGFSGIVKEVALPALGFKIKCELSPDLRLVSCSITVNRNAWTRIQSGTHSVDADWPADWSKLFAAFDPACAPLSTPLETSDHRLRLWREGGLHLRWR